MSTETNVMELTNFRLPEMVDGADFTNEDLADDMDGLRLKFQRIKIPAGGALQFEMPGGDPENPDYAKTIEGVIVHNHASNAYWAEGSEDDEEATPLCTSVDGKLGFGDPGGACAACAANKFNSAPKGKGKACKNTRVLYLLRDGEFMPIIIILPPTSISPFNDFYNSHFILRRRTAFGSVISIGLKRVENGNTYSVATFKKLFDFTGEQLAQISNYAKGFKAQINAFNQQRVIEAANRGDDMYDNYNGSDGERVGVSVPGAIINGDEDDLPL